MSESLQEQIEFLKSLRHGHVCYMKEHLESWAKLHRELDQAISDKIAELIKQQHD